MVSRNNSFFDPELCQNGHFAVTGFTNDHFCLNNLGIVDIKQALHYYLRYEQGFDAVFYLDRNRMVYCYDEQSYNILTGQTSQKTECGIGALGRVGPVAQRRKQNETAAANPGTEHSWNLGRRTVEASWQQITGVFKNADYRCALVLPDANLMQGGEDTLLELASYRSDKKPVVIYIFRETNINNLETSINNLSDWAIPTRNILPSRIASKPEDNRVISIGPPNCLEVCNLIQFLSLNKTDPVRIRRSDIPKLGVILSASCARNNWGLDMLRLKLTSYAQTHPDDVLSIDSWCKYTGEEGYREPMDVINSRIGQEKMKKELQSWYNDQMNRPDHQKMPVSSSRFSPLPSSSQRLGHGLNVCLKGRSGTGKTTTARLIGQLYYSLGLLPKAHVVECSAADLVSGYVGHTAEQVQQKVQEAMGGSLLIDEASALDSNENGKEAIKELLAQMSMYQGQLAFYFTDYPLKIDMFMKKNEGIARRVPREYILEEYTPEEMQAIYIQMANDDPDEIEFDEEWRAAMPDFFKTWVDSRDGSWGNAGEAENLLVNMKRNAGARNHEAGAYILTPADVPEKLRFALKQRCKNMDEAISKIDQLIGLGNVKEFLKQRVNAIRLGNADDLPNNFVFYGNPGTGKTTVARIVAEILYLMGAVRRNHVTEVKAGELRDGSKKICDVVEEARGGVFFLDEAHQLAGDEVGKQIILNLVTLVEDDEVRKDTCFILAGYQTEMKKFLDTDDGLNSRFPARNRIRFNDYTASELVGILKKMAEDRNLVVTEEYLTRSELALEKYLSRQHSDFGNGRYIRNIYLPDSIEAQNSRLINKINGDSRKVLTDEQLASLSEQDRNTLTADDLPRNMIALAGPTGIKTPHKKTPMEKLEALQGKDAVIRFAKSRIANAGEPEFCDEVTGFGLNYTICGPAGSGRHTAVRALAEVWRDAGLLENSRVDCAGKTAFEAGYIGQTGLKTRDVIERSSGATLVVENPSTMLPRGANDHTFGIEALNELVSAVGGRQDMSIVFLDTVEGMKMFLEAMPTLKSLLAKNIQLDLFTGDQTLTVLKEKTANSDVLEPELMEEVRLWIEEGKAGGRGFSGIDIQNLINDMHENWKLRNGDTVQAEGEPKKRLLRAEDFPQKLKTSQMWQKCIVPVDGESVKTEQVRAIETEEQYTAACHDIGQSVVLIETMKNGNRGFATGTIISSDGIVLTCQHVAAHADSVRVKVWCPGAIGGDYHWFNATVLNPMDEACDMALLKIDGTNFVAATLRPADSTMESGEETVLLGYPLGGRLNGNTSALTMSNFKGRVASVQRGANGVDRVYIDSTGLHGNSGSPVISAKDGRVIGVFSGSIIPDIDNSLDELNYFYPIRYFFESFVGKDFSYLERMSENE